MTSLAVLVQHKAEVLAFGDDRHVIKTEYRERCFIYQSFGLSKNTFGEHQVKPHMTFLADSGNGFAAEWEPQYGPIQIWTQCEEGWKGEGVFGNEIEAKAHWHFPFVKDGSLDWSQSAVQEERLPYMLGRGDIDGVFDVLERWADRS